MTVKPPNIIGKSASTSYRSLDNLLSILPVGTLSKNVLIGANNNYLIILLCNFLEVINPLQNNIVTLINTIKVCVTDIIHNIYKL